MKKFKFIVLIIIIVIVVITILQNLQPINLQFIFWPFQITTAILIIITAIIGYILGLLSVWILKKKKK